MAQRIEIWTNTYLRLSEADRKENLGPEELEELALAAFLTGWDEESFQFLERAHQGYLNLEKTPEAIRSAFWLGFMLMNAGEQARSSGWFARGERLLGDDQDKYAAERGLFLIPEALKALYSGKTARAQHLFESVESTGEKFQNANLIVLGRLGHGQALIQQNEVSGGIQLLDETMVSIETEEVFPLVNGIVYCAVIESCRKVWDLKRAQEWTSVLTRWCEAQPDIVPFRGECLVRRAEIIQFHGEWDKALKETADACELLSQHPGKPIAGEAYYRKAELQRLAGEYKAAEASYQEAAKWGRNPQPGLSLLRLAQGRDDVAKTSIRTILRETEDRKKRAELLSACVKIMVAGKQTGEAAEAAEELGNIAVEMDVPYLHALSSHCMGAVSFARGDIPSAMDELQTALNFWSVLDLPYEAARTRELRGLVYRALNDKDNSDAELVAARWVFEQLNAIPDLERVNGILDGKHQHETFGLTLRELQVLRLVASGKTNKSVAADLFISDRTVDRHMSNIFNKLGVSSRVEATTFALNHKLLDRAI